MAKITLTTLDGTVRTVTAEPNRTLMETIRDEGVNELLAICGGCCACATCHVYVDSAYLERLSPMSEDEDALLGDSVHRQATSRLSCQVRLTEAVDGMSVRIAPPA